jgi:hypothetical protein
MRDRVNIFAYGSDISIEHAVKFYPEMDPVCPAVLKDYELAFWDNGNAAMIHKDGAVLQGFVWSVPKELLEIVDNRKHYPSLKKKKTVTVNDYNTGKELTATVYYADERYLSPFPPSAEYFGRMVEGYWWHRMETKPLFEALENVNRDLVMMHSGQFQRSANRPKTKPKNRER